MEQLDYLFTHNQSHSYSELNSLVEEVMNMHQKFIQSDEEMIKSYGIEQERLLIESRMMRNIIKIVFGLSHVVKYKLRVSFIILLKI
mgnify:CR=1 FL=1